MMKKYKTYADFENDNTDAFGVIRKAIHQLKAPDTLGEDGFILAEAEKLEHFFLKAVNTCTDLLFGLSASVLDAQANVADIEGILYGQKTGGATDRNRAVSCDVLYLQATKNYNDLVDLKKYLENKREDMDKNHYFYKSMRQSK